MKKNLPVTQVEREFSAEANILSTTNIKGTVTYINEDFVDISGFEPEELLDKNHNVVRHPDMPPGAFADLWATIKQGKPWMGIVKNRCKNGDHYWVDAFVTPIQDEGRIVEYQSVRSKPSRENVARAEAIYTMLNQGKLPWQLRWPLLRLRSKLFLSLLGALTPFIYLAATEAGWMATGIATALSLWIAGIAMHLSVRPFDKALAEAREVTVNPITQMVFTGDRTEAGQIRLALKMLESERGAVIGRVSDSTTLLSTNAQKLAAVVEENNTAIQQQQQETDSVATAINQMSASVQEVAGHTQLTTEAADRAQQAAASGRQVVNDTASGIDQLAAEVEKASAVIARLQQDSNNISAVLDVIKGIAEQTNLLALNAAIEAARAGEQGRGFAVVADEVRTLASRTQHSTTEIEAMIATLQSAAGEAVVVMEESREKAQGSVAQANEAAASLQEITEAVSSITEMSSQIAVAMDEQSGVAEEVSRSITNIRHLSETTSENAATIESSAADMAAMATDLQQLIRQF